MVKTRSRIRKGTLVCSTNGVNQILSKRFIVNVLYKENYRSVSYIVGDNRVCINQ